MIRLLVPAVLALGVIAGLPAQVAAQGISDRMQKEISRDPDRALRNFAQMLLALAPNGQLTQADIDRHNSIEDAKARAALAEDLLAMDLDFDGAVTAQELAVAGYALQGSRKADNILIAFEGDTNGDMVLDFDELRAAVQKQFEKHRKRQVRNQPYDVLMQFDANGDGTVVIAELAQVVKTIAAGNCENACKAD